LISAFGAVGYTLRLPWKILDAADYGTPQHRERLILFGSKNGSTVANYPLPTCIPADRPKGNSALPIGSTCRDALGDLPNADRFELLKVNDSILTGAYGKPSPYAMELRGQANDSWHFGYVRKWNPLLLTSSARTEHTEISRRRFEETRPGEIEPISRFFKLPPDGLSNTLRAGTDGARGAFTSPRPIHYKHPRCITVREMARLHGFPDWFRLHATKWHGARQIGNAVPPPLARAIASEVLSALKFRPTQPPGEVALGDENLLHLDISEAAKHFGVVPPRSRRNKKSGAKKRKQQEIEEARTRLKVANG
jgi:DNA (cytosine-5)-methyltransferase 1